ncbi:MAG: hypothetical protein KGO96_14315 [Elusimicrobia bacterium]|nr:hypothetical protein [Elusimicrobiota bacterium]
MIHQVLEIVLFSSVLVVVIANAGGFNAVTGALGNAYGSGFRTIIGLGG